MNTAPYWTRELSLPRLDTWLPGFVDYWFIFPRPYFHSVRLNSRTGSFWNDTTIEIIECPPRVCCPHFLQFETTCTSCSVSFWPNLQGSVRSITVQILRGRPTRPTYPPGFEPGRNGSQGRCGTATGARRVNLPRFWSVFKRRTTSRRIYHTAGRGSGFWTRVFWASKLLLYQLSYPPFSNAM
jgi:hypothetical protein